MERMADCGPDITAHTGLLGLIGHPVRHSLSPHIHNAALRHQGLDFVYLAFDVPHGRLAAAVDGLRAIGARGANVTVPHKEGVVELMDHLDPLAARVGAVNTIVNERGVLTGHNTDVEGFQRALHSLLPEGALGRRCLVAGAGGAARAVVAALVDEQAREIIIYNRTPSRAELLCNAALDWGATHCTVVTDEMLAEAGLSAEIVVNATSVGLHPSVKETPFPVDMMNGRQVVIDLLYGTAPTALVRQASALGAVTVDGMEMLLMQAASSYRLWTGLEAPVEMMRGVIRRLST